MYIFLCYSSQDKLTARALYNRLSVYRWLSTWFEFGTNRNVEEVVENSNVVILLLSQQSVSQRGYQKKYFFRTLRQIKKVKEKGKKRLLVLPFRLDECSIPEQLQYLPWKDYFSANAFEELINAVWTHWTEVTGPAVYAVAGKQASKEADQYPVEGPAEYYEKIDWHNYVKIPTTSEVDYPFFIREHPVSNEQYMRFLRAADYADQRFWMHFPKFDENCNPLGNWGDAGLEWLRKVLQDYQSLLDKRLDWKWYQTSRMPYDFRQPNHPAVGITWLEANAYCKWFSLHWQELPEAKSLSMLITPKSNVTFRLPLETEMHAALRYDNKTRLRVDPTGRFCASGISISVSEIDMLANLYGANRKGSLVYCNGTLYLDENERDKCHLSDRGSFPMDLDDENFVFRIVIAES